MQGALYAALWQVLRAAFMTQQSLVYEPGPGHFKMLPFMQNGENGFDVSAPDHC